MIYEDKIILNVVKLRITSIFAHKMDSVWPLRIIFSNSVINGSFLTYATEILDEPVVFVQILRIIIGQFFGIMEKLASFS